MSVTKSAWDVDCKDSVGHDFANWDHHSGEDVPEWFFEESGGYQFRKCNKCGLWQRCQV